MIFITNWKITARAVGPFVVVGRYFKGLPVYQQHAIVSHERGHIARWHALKRIALLLVGQRRRLQKAFHQHEFEADEYAVRDGHAKGLLDYLAAHNVPQFPTFPPIAERIIRIKSLVQELENGK